MRVESICIVGGGSSGWMTAALLSKAHPDIQIALVESERIKRIGVGESTLGHFNRFLRRLELEDKDWMPYCNATYKTSIAFKNFREGKGERFQYPFGNFDLYHDYKGTPITFFELQAKYGKELYPPEEFARYVNTQTFLAERCKIPWRSVQGDLKMGNFIFDDDTAYHFDADLFGQYLKEHIALPNGVVHMTGDVEMCVKDHDGNMTSVLTSDGKAIQADLYIDCTGFKSLLLEKHMDVPFVSFNDQLFNDRAIATHIPYVDREKDMESYTDCIAMSSGWVWNIPLWNRVGTGYVYSSKYQSDGDALLEFKHHLATRFSPESAQECQFMPIKIRHGKHKVAWERNVVGIGLSYGFLEPLESTGLMTTHEAAILLSDALERREGFVSKFDKDSFNFTTNNMIEAMKNFIVMHYSMSQREDTPYWSDCVNHVKIDKGWDPIIEYGESQRIACENVNALLNSLDGGSFQNNHFSGQMYIAAGLGFKPITKSMYHERMTFTGNPNHPDLENCHQMWQNDRKRIIEWVDTQPSTYEYLKKEIYGTV